MSLTVTFSSTDGFGPPPSGTKAAPKLRILLFTNAAVPASQNGGKASASSAYQVAVTVAATGSFVVGVNEAPSTVSFTADTLSTQLDNIQDSTNGTRHGTFIGKALTASTGSQTYGSSTAFSSDGGCVAAEIKKSSAGTLTRNTAAEPAVATSTTGSTVTTAAFTPSPGDLIVALPDALCVTSTLTDSMGLTWTKVIEYTSDGYAAVFIAQYPVLGTGSVKLKKMGLSGSGSGSGGPAPIFMADYPAASWAVQTTPRTATVTAETSDQLVVLAGTEGSLATLETPSGGSLTYTLQADVEGVTNYGNAYAWTAPVGSGGSITVSNALNSSGYYWGFDISPVQELKRNRRKEFCKFHRYAISGYHHN